MEVLFHQLRLDYQVPIISQQGEVCGKLHIEVYRLPFEEGDHTNIARRDSISSESIKSDESTCTNSRMNMLKKDDYAMINPVDFLGSLIRCRVIFLIPIFKFCIFRYALKKH